MKKQLLMLLVLLCQATGAHAVPAEPGLWRTLTLTDGTTVEALLTGDEHAHYWLGSDGKAYRAVAGSDDQLFETVDFGALSRQSLSRQQRLNEQRQRRIRRNVVGDRTNYSGQKRGLVVLVEFSDTKFQTSHNRALYQNICNQQGYTSTEGFKGSVRDYFSAQSYGAFDLTFDVVGPVAVSKSSRYYGANDDSGYDLYPGELTAAVCQAIDSQVNFANYDWDGDKEVDQVMIIYAGRGEADGGGSYTIWPHEWTLSESDYGRKLQLDGVSIDTYAMANELRQSGINGIGTICHEFSHCLGLPDFYDTINNRNYGLGAWSLMSNGNYNGSSFVPAGYTSYERYCCGWLKPTELTATTTVGSMQPLSQSPEAYSISNEAYPNEFFLLENRQADGWDARLPGRGLLVIHVDYDQSIWDSNVVNSTLSASDARYYDVTANDHQRCTIVRASNQTGSNGIGDAYPYNANNALTNTSTPAATLYHANSDGKKLLNIRLLNITQQADGSLSFNFYDTAENGPIVNIKAPQHPAPDAQAPTPPTYYDLQGRRFADGQQPNRRGVYIINGKKVIL